MYRLHKFTLLYVFDDKYLKLILMKLDTVVPYKKNHISRKDLNEVLCMNPMLHQEVTSTRIF